MMANLPTLLVGVPWTLGLTAVAFVTGALLGAPLCAMRISLFAILRFISTAMVLTFRSVPPIVWLFLIFFGIGSGTITVTPFGAACVGLGLITAANMSEIYRGALRAIHKGQWEASAALGLPSVSVLGEVVGPQLVRIALPAAATYVIGLLKDSAVASVIGVPELAFQGYRLSQQTFRGLDVYATVALIYIAMSLPIAWLSRTVDLRMRSRVAR